MDTTTYYLTAANSEGCNYSDSLTVNVIDATTPSTVGTMLPADNSLNMDVPIHFSWEPADNASHYDVYMWEQGTTQPNTPYQSNTAAIHLTRQDHSFSNADYGKTFNWQVVSKNNCLETTGITQTFMLRSLPDLVVDSLSIPDEIAAGSSLALDWVVTNIGVGSTLSTTWQDRIWLSTDTQLDNNFAGPSDDILIGVVSNLSYLQSGQSYLQSQSIPLDPSWVGQFYLIIEADGRRFLEGNHIKETNEDNNYLLDTLLIYPAPLPDLKINTIGFPSNAFGHDLIDITYNVENNGLAAIRGKIWQDNLYISPDSIFSLATATELKKFLPFTIGSKLATGKSYCPTCCYCESGATGIIAPDGMYPDSIVVLQPDSSYTKTVEVRIPHTYLGDYYIFVFTDFTDNILESAAEINNIQKGANPISISLRPPPDLVVDSLGIPNTAASSTDIQIGFKIKNEGANPPVENFWQDKIYLSPLDTFNVNALTELKTTYHLEGTSLESGDSYTQLVNVQVPDGIEGDYYLYIETDAEQEVFEYIHEDNNTFGKPIHIDLAPYPDLIPNMELPDTIVAGYAFDYNFTIANSGGAATQGNWKDQVKISLYPDYDKVSKEQKEYNNLQGLEVNENYTQNITHTLPVNYLGKYYFITHADRPHWITKEDNIYEHLGKDNNILIDSAIVVQLDADLQISNFNAPNSGFSGTNITVNCNISNEGEGFTNALRWMDMVYISTDSLLSNDDIEIIRRSRGAPLDKDEGYVFSHTAQLPNGLDGQYYLLMLTDRYNWVTNDILPSNNILVHPLDITLSDPIDLVVDTLIVPATVYAGQYINIPFTINNEGIGNLSGINWHNSFHLHTSDVYASGLTQIGSRGGLNIAANSSYNDGATVRIPSYYQGSYYLILKSDTYDRIYEHGGEENNTKAVLITILPPPPSDLQITAMSMPDNIIPGDALTVHYTVKNTGTELAIGDLRDILYFSLDTVLHPILDPVFGFQDNYIELEPGDSLNLSLNTTMPGVKPNDYRGIGWTNAQNTIAEANLQNNERVTDESITVTIPVLTLEVQENDIPLDFEEEIYYQVTVGENLDLLITLDSDKEEGINEIYVSYNNIPSPNEYDYRQLHVHQTDQQVLIPETQAGTYYIMATSFNSFNEVQKVGLLAQALPFSILNSTPNVVGQGKVTCQLNGAGFRDSIEVVLKSKVGVVVDTAEIRELTNSMQMKVRWTLEDVPTGVYDVVAINSDNSEAILVDGLTIEETYEEIGIVRNGPEVLLAGTSQTYGFVFQNIGNVDVDIFNAQIMTFAPSRVVNVQSQDDKLYQYTDFLNPNEVSPYVYRDDYEAKDTAGLHTFRVVPLLGQDITPGEFYQCDVSFAGFVRPRFPLAVGVETLSTEEYVERHSSGLTALHEDILAHPENYPNDDFFLNLASAGLENFVDSLFQYYVEYGIVQQEDIENLNYEVVSMPTNPDFIGGEIDLLNTDTCTLVRYMCRHSEKLVCDVETKEIDRINKHIFGGVCSMNTNYFACAQMDCPIVVAPVDPNEILGPAGYETPQWVGIDNLLPYKIYFENDPDLATAPAQRVVIRQALDEDTNPYSVRLGQFGFGAFTFEVPENTINYTTTLDLTDSLNVNVEVTAGLDIIERELFWIFQTKDPQTGLPPYDPFGGFLPVNDTLVGNGEGFVSYTILSANNTETQDSIFAQADIVFDNNEAIATNIWFNTVDAHKPVSSIDNLASTSNTTQIALSWTGTDVGSGIAKYALYVAESDGNFRLHADELTSTTMDFEGVDGSTYQFFTIATDHTGNVEGMKTSGETTVTVEVDDCLHYVWIEYENTDNLPQCVIAEEYIEVGDFGNGVVSILNDQNVYFEAGKYVTLKPGFEVQPGGVFEVVVDTSSHSIQADKISKESILPIVQEIAVYPNPFQNHISFAYQLTEAAQVELQLYDLAGKSIELIDNKKQAKDEYTVNFDGCNLASGMYIFHLKINDEVFTKKVLKAD